MERNNPLVSVIIPAYNSGKYIAQAIDSVLGQTYGPIEIIVINDGSTDDTGDIVKAYGDKVRSIHQENQGPSAARNAGITGAKGEYIAFLDADDAWLPGKIEKQVKVMEKRPELGLVCSGSYVVDKDDRVITEWNMPESGEETFESVYDQNFILCLTVMVRKECLDKVGLFDGSLFLSQDYDLWLRIIKHYPFHYVNEPLARYRVHSTNITRSIRKRYDNNLAVVNKPEIVKGLRLLTRVTRNGKGHYYFGDIFLKRRHCFAASWAYLKSVICCPWVGAYYRPPECKQFRFSLPYRIFKVYGLIFISLYRGIKQSLGFKIPEYDLYRRIWIS